MFCQLTHKVFSLLLPVHLIFPHCVGCVQRRLKAVCRHAQPMQGRGEEMCSNLMASLQQLHDRVVRRTSGDLRNAAANINRREQEADRRMDIVEAAAAAAAVLSAGGRTSQDADAAAGDGEGDSEDGGARAEVEGGEDVLSGDGEDEAEQEEEEWSADEADDDGEDEEDEEVSEEMSDTVFSVLSEVVLASDSDGGSPALAASSAFLARLPFCCSFWGSLATVPHPGPRTSFSIFGKNHA